MKNHILWDLDGTLTDPKEGIIRSIRYALKKFGRPAPEIDELLWCIGPPLSESFPQLVPGCSEKDVSKLIEYYRERFSELGLYENDVYPEIPSLLARLSDEKKLFVATSKPHVYAQEIIEHFDLASHFTHVHGSELNGERCDKGELIQYILEKEKIHRRDVLIVGDRKHDVIGAKKAGILSIGVTWGYGTSQELEEAGADFIFDRPSELGEFLLQTLH